MTQSLPVFSGTQGSSAIAAVLESIREELLPELDALRTVFQQEVAPRAKRIGDLLRRAQGNFPRNLDFYDWADTAVGLKQRQIRNYIRFSERLAAIEAAAEDQAVPISSIEQGLALLTPTKEDDTRSEEEVRVAAVAQATGRAKGALSRAMECIYEFAPGGLTQTEQRLFQDLSDVLTRWGSTTSTPEQAIEVVLSPELAVNRQEPEPTDAQWPEEDGLPFDLKPSKWTLSQLEEGIARFDGSQANLAKKLGVSRASISSNLKSKRAAAGLSKD